MILGGCMLKAYEKARKPAVISVDPETTPFWGPAEINSYVLRYLRMYDSKGQLLAHRVAILAIGLLILSSPALRRLLPAFEQPRIRSAILSLALCTSLASYALCLHYGGQPWWTPVTATSVLSTLGLLAIGNTICRSPLDRIGGAIVLGIVVVANLPGLISKIDLSNLDHYSVISCEQHYDSVLGSADRLAAGHQLVKDVYPYYGLLLPLFLAAYQRYVRPLSMGDLILILQLLQFVYLVCCAYLFYGFSRGRWWLCLLALLLVVPWYYFSHKTVLVPNQSAWRTIGFPLALLAIRVVHGHRLAPSSFVLGCVAGLFLLLNTETGIPISLGLLAYLFFRTRAPRPQSWFPGLLNLILFPLGLTASCLGFALGWRFLLGYWPDPLVLKQIFDYLASASSTGFGGLRYPGDLLPVALFAWSSFALIYISLASGGNPSLTNSFRVCVAVIALVWLSYYANRPDFWNLSSFSFLFGFPAIDASRWLLSGIRRHRIRNAAGLSAFALISIITIPYINKTLRYNLNMNVNYNICDVLRPPAWKTTRDKDRAQLSGVDLNADLAREIESKSRVIARIGRDGPVIYLTMDSYLISKVSGVNTALPINGLLFGPSTRGRYSRILDFIRGSEVREIYVDPPDGKTERESQYFLKFYRQLLLDLQVVYRFDHTIDGWEVWTKKREGSGRVGGGESRSRPGVRSLLGPPERRPGPPDPGADKEV